MDEFKNVIVDIEEIDEIIDYVMASELKGWVDIQIGSTLVEMLENLKGQMD